FVRKGDHHEKVFSWALSGLRSTRLPHLPCEGGGLAAGRAGDERRGPCLRGRCPGRRLAGAGRQAPAHRQWRTEVSVYRRSQLRIRRHRELPGQQQLLGCRRQLLVGVRSGTSPATGSRPGAAGSAARLTSARTSSSATSPAGRATTPTTATGTAVTTIVNASGAPARPRVTP